MKGQKYNDDIKEKAIAMLTVNNSVSYVAKKLELPRSTVKTWKIQFDKRAEANGEDNIAKLRQKKKEGFINDAWVIIDTGTQILSRRLKRALESEDKLDALEKEIMSLPNTELSTERKKALARQLASIKVEDIGKLTVALATLYDKQALANGEATSREEQILKGFEDY